jgi:hypothetical protein
MTVHNVTTSAGNQAPILSAPLFCVQRSKMPSSLNVSQVHSTPSLRIVE